MMRIADQHFTTLKIKKHLSDNVFCRYTDSANCLHNMLWYIYGQLELNRNVVLIVDSEEHLRAVSYFISKYRLSDRSTIVSNNQRLNPLSDDITKVTKEDREEVRSKLDHQLNLVNDQVVELTRPCHGDMSIIELNDRQLIQANPVSSSGKSSYLLTQISNADLSDKKAMLKRSQDMYDPSFRHLDKLNPFNSDIIHNDIKGIKSYLSDTMVDINKLTLKFDKYEAAIAKASSSEVIDKINSLRKIQNEINSLRKPNSEAYTPTEIVKIEYNLNLLRKEIQDHSEPEKDLNLQINDIVNKIENYSAALRNESSRDIDDLQKKINMYSSDIDIMELYNDIIAIQDNINIAEILSKNYNRKAVSFYNLKLIIDDIAKDLDYALFFIDYNAEYLSWNKYYETLPPIDQDIINHFIHEKSSWEDSFTAQLSYTQIEQSLLRVESLPSSMRGMHDTIRDYTDMGISLSDEIQKSDINHTAVGSLHVHYNSDIDHGADKAEQSVLVTLNDIPEVVQQFSSVKIFAYSEKFDEAAVSRLKSIQDIEIINDAGTYYNINKKLSQLKSHELNMASLYLGQSLRALSSNYSILKLKSVAIVSFLSELKNAQLRDLLYAEGVKEIFSNVENYNLLPGIFSDTAVKPILLLEDGLFDKNDLSTLIRQIIIKEEVKVAGIEIIEVDNYRLLNGDDTMSTFTQIISERNRGVQSSLV